MCIRDRSWAKAEAQGLKVMTSAEAAKNADIIMILINDEKQAKLYKESIEPNLTEGKTLAFAHGFNIHFGCIKPPKNVNVIMIAPKGPGHTVRSEYQAGKGVPCLIAVEQDATGDAWDIGCLLYTSHFVPNKDIKAAEQSKVCREFSCCHGISHFYDVGKMGIEHALLPEQGVVTAGDCIIGADSHTCTYGALGAFSTGVGSTDMAAGMATGTAWFKVPSAIKFNLTGKLPSNCSGKDVILSIIGQIGVDGALYKSMEFTGEGVSRLSMDDRLCICNMAIEAGAKNGIFPVDEKTLDYMLSLIHI